MNQWFQYVFGLALLFFTSLFSVDFVLFTQPKTGTHLLIPILEKLTGKGCYWPEEMFHPLFNTQTFFEERVDFSNPRYFFYAMSRLPWTVNEMNQVWETSQRNRLYIHVHAPYTQNMENYLLEKKAVSFFLKRDPRDMIVSLMNHYKYIQWNNPNCKGLSTDDETLLCMIKSGLRSYAVNFIGWLDSPACCVIDFEKLLGEFGGAATQMDALSELRKIARALNLNVSDAYLLQVYNNSLGTGWSFFKGKVGAWKDYFNEVHKDAVKNEIGDILIKLGYENNNEW